MYKKLKITFRAGNWIVFDDGEWDDYDIAHGFLIIKRNGGWISSFAADEVFSVRLFKDGEDC